MEKTQKELIKELKTRIKEMAAGQKPLKNELKEQFTLYMRTLEETRGDRNMFPWGKAFEEKVGFDYNPTEARQQSKESVRCYLLAYGFLRGVPYRAMEQKTRQEDNWTKKGRAHRVHVIYSKYFAKDSRIPFITQEEIERTFCGDDNGS